MKKMENHWKGRKHAKDKICTFPTPELTIFHQTAFIPLSLLSGTSCSTDPITLESLRAWSSGCFSINTHFLMISSMLLAWNSQSPAQTSLLHRHSDPLPETSTQIKDRHLKTNITNCFPYPQICSFSPFTSVAQARNLGAIADSPFFPQFTSNPSANPNCLFSKQILNLTFH